MNITLPSGTAAANDDFGNTYSALFHSVGACTDAGRVAQPCQPVSLQPSGNVILDNALLRQLRRLRLLSQRDLADDCWRRKIRVSVATIKRAESGHAVRYRVARELARCFDVPVMQLVDVARSGADQRQ